MILPNGREKNNFIKIRSMKISTVLFAFLVFAMKGYSQQKTMDKAVIQTPTIQCEKCKARIENILSHQFGITAVKVDVKKKTTTVTWIKDRTDIETIKAAIANLGYDADDVAAEETAYKKLPPSCKKPEINTTEEKKEIKD